ncbi:MAG: OmpA family protein, partial [Thiohalobacterales bacterium]|nr:OmpA family protein [Thiohalobacterales bacterium]
MNLRSLATVAVLLAPALFAIPAQAWWGGPGYTNSGYYGAGPVHSDIDGGMGFGTSMRGRGHGSGLHRHGTWSRAPLYRYMRAGRPAWILRGVNFKYDSAELTPPSMAVLDSVAAVLRERPVQPLEVGGHASAEGDAPYNMELSKKRAQTVRAYLVKRGVKPELLTYRGYGETRPLAP